MSTGTKGAGGRRPHNHNGYDTELVNAEALAVCDHYLTERRREGRRYVYRCPDCGKLDFEMEPVKGFAGCFNPACPMPKTTDALGIISHLEGLERRGAEFIRCVEKGYEILGLATPPDADGTAASAPTENGTRGRAKKAGSTAPVEGEGLARDGSPARTLGRRWVRQNGADNPEVGELGPAAASARPGSGWSAGSHQPPEERTGRPAPRGERAYPVEAYFEGPDGEMIPTEAVIVEEPDAAEDLPDGDADPTEPIEEVLADETPDSVVDDGTAPDADTPQPPPHGGGESVPADDVRDARLFDRAGSRALASERELRHAVYERLLALCPLEKRDEAFFEGRGLDRRTIEQGWFGSISAKRSRWVADKLGEAFGEDLLKVPGFYRPEAGPEAGPRRGAGQIRFSLYGDYALIPYHDAEGYITTVEGRLIGEPKNKRDKKYKALLGSGVHLYVHPSFQPGEVVAFCEGAIGAMVAARYGIPVAAIKGFRNYKVSGRERGDEDTVLPELEGVDFAGRTVVYVPDVDVKPRSREEVMEAVPAACEWLISRQGGIPKVALLPEGAKDLDAWLLSLPEAQRVAETDGLLSGAVSLGEWAGVPEGEPHPQLHPQLRPQHADGTKRSDDTPPTPEQRATDATRRFGGPEGRSRLLSDGAHDPTGAAVPSREAFDSASESKSQDDDPPTPGLRPDTHQAQRTGTEDTDPQAHPDHRGGTSGDSPPAAHDAERARKGPMHPAMARWYEVAGYTDQQVTAARQQTAIREITGKRKPPVRDTPVSLPTWTPGDVVLALGAAFAVAVVLWFLAYAIRAQEGSMAAVGELVTWPPWWLEAALYAWVGALAANWMAGRRHRERRRRLRAHLRGEE